MTTDLKQLLSGYGMMICNNMAFECGVCHRQFDADNVFASTKADNGWICAGCKSGKQSRIYTPGLHEPEYDVAEIERRIRDCPPGGVILVPTGYLQYRSTQQQKISDAAINMVCDYETVIGDLKRENARLKRGICGHYHYNTSPTWEDMKDIFMNMGLFMSFAVILILGDNALEAIIKYFGAG